MMGVTRRTMVTGLALAVTILGVGGLWNQTDAQNPSPQAPKLGAIVRTPDEPGLELLRALVTLVARHSVSTGTLAPLPDVWLDRARTYSHPWLTDRSFIERDVHEVGIRPGARASSMKAR